MAKAVVLKTDHGIKLFGNTQCSNGLWFDAQGCFNYCNMEVSENMQQLQASKLIYGSTTLASNPKQCSDWFKNRENFIDVEISYECDQSYKMQ